MGVCDDCVIALESCEVASIFLSEDHHVGKVTPSLRFGIRII